MYSCRFFFNDPATTEIYTLSLHDALPICLPGGFVEILRGRGPRAASPARRGQRSEEHTSELQSLTNLVCRLLLEKKNEAKRQRHIKIATASLQGFGRVDWSLLVKTDAEKN